MKLSPRARIALLVGLLLLGATVSALWAGEDLLHPAAMKVRIKDVLADLGPWAPVAYIVLYWVSPFLLLPAIPISLVGGILFGPVWGAIWGLIGSTGGACTSFLAGRAMGHEFVSRHAHGKVLMVKAMVEKEGWRVVALIRLVPVLPFGVVNVILGTTDIRFWVYAVTSFLAMAPGAFVYAYIGYAGREAASGAEGLTKKLGFAVGLLVVLAGLPAAIRYAQARRALDSSPDSALRAGRGFAPDPLPPKTPDPVKSPTTPAEP